ncbi:MAG: hypothetical protein RLY31_2604 [Bacteroidota bacterium]|jgi:uncharacterized YccA/Bax inhibitor family protein
MLRHDTPYPDGQAACLGNPIQYGKGSEEARRVLDAVLISGNAGAPIRRTVDKSLVMLAFLIPALLASLLFPSPVFLTMGALGSLLLWAMTIVFPSLSGVFAKTYALLSGLLLGSATNQLLGLGGVQPVVLPVVLLTVLSLLSRLLSYRYPDHSSRYGRAVAIGLPLVSIAFCYLLQLMAWTAGHPVVWLHEAGWPQWLSLTALAIPASRYMTLHTDPIRQNLRPGSPEHMEWYAAMACISVLFWCYLGGWKMLWRRKEPKPVVASTRGSIESQPMR